MRYLSLLFLQTPARPELAEVRRVIDGDTPETVDPRKPVEAFGREASTFLHKTLDGLRARIELDPIGDKVDRYGRTLAYRRRGATDRRIGIASNLDTKHNLR